MEKQEIEDFLSNKKGYLKKGAKQLRNILRDRGFETTIKVCREALSDTRRKFNELDEKIEDAKARILILDIETSPNIGWFWRAGYKQNISHYQILKERAIICASYKWHGEKQVYNLAWDKKQDDKFLIEQLVDVMNESDVIVAHNGDRFDIKWLKTRALYHRIPMLPKYVSVDTLKIARSKLYLNSNTLDYISKFLGFEGKLETAKNLWNDVVHLNDREALKDMITYCNEDVVQLEKVYDELKVLDNPKLHVGVLNGKTRQTSPVTGTYNIRHIKSTTTAAGTLKHTMQDVETGSYFEMSNTNYKKYKEINE